MFKGVNAAWGSLSSKPALLFCANTGQLPTTAGGMSKGVASPCAWWTGVFWQIMKLQPKRHLPIRHRGLRWPLGTWPKTGHWGADVTCTAPLSAVEAGSHSLSGMHKSSCHPWWLLGIIAKFSHSFYARCAKLPLLSSNHWRNDTVAMSCLCEQNQQFLCPVHLSPGTPPLFFPA